MKKTYRKWEIQSSSQNLLCANVLASTFQKKTEDNFPAVTNARVLVSFLLWLVEHVKNRSRNSYRKPRMSQGNSTSTAAWNGFHITIFIFLTDFSSKIPFFTTDASHHANSRVFNFIKNAWKKVRQGILNFNKSVIFCTWPLWTGLKHLLKRTYLPEIRILWKQRTYTNTNLSTLSTLSWKGHQSISL